MKGVKVLFAHKSGGNHRKVKNLDGKNNSAKIVGPKAKGGR